MKRAFPLILILVIVGAAASISLRGRRAAAEHLVRASGRVAADPVTVAARAPGRVSQLLAEVGDEVTRGQVLAYLASAGAPADHDDSPLARAALDAKLRAEEANLAVLQARVPLAIKAAETSLELARAMEEQAASIEQQHAAELEQLRAVAEPDDELRSRVAAAELAHEQARQELTVARASVANAEADLSLARLSEQGVAAMISEVEALRAERDAAARRSAPETADARTGVLSPVGGAVVMRHASEGFGVEAGAPLFEIVPPEGIHVIAVVAQRQLAAISPGQEARVFAESAPHVPIEARVSGIIAGEGEAAASWMVRVTPLKPAPSLVIGSRAEVIIRADPGARWPE